MYKQVQEIVRKCEREMIKLENDLEGRYTTYMMGTENEKRFNDFLSRLVKDYGINSEEELRKAAETNKLYIDIFTEKVY